MQTLQYEVSKIKKYELDIWQSASCKYLAPIKLYDNEIIWSEENCQNIKDYLIVDRKASVTERMLKLLAVTRKIIEAVSCASDYLIEENSISLDPEKLWFGSDNNILLFPEYSEGEFFDRLCKLLVELNGEPIANRIAEKNRESAFSYKTLLRFLSSWELEIR